MVLDSIIYDFILYGRWLGCSIDVADYGANFQAVLQLIFQDESIPIAFIVQSCDDSFIMNVKIKTMMWNFDMNCTNKRIRIL